MQVTIYNLQNNPKEQVEVSDLMFNAKVNNYLIWLAVTTELANAHVGTADTKTKAEVEGSGTKPWRQKGTGRARVGTKRNPVWRKGGVAFGPHPRSFAKQINKKMKRLAYISLFSLKMKKDQIKIIEDIQLDEAKTRKLSEIIKPLNLPSNSLLIYGDKKFKDDGNGYQILTISDNDRNIKNAALNLNDLTAFHWNNLAAKDIFYAKQVIITASALHYLEEKYLPLVMPKIQTVS
jgi:large subunit ribosomal protein L4